MPCKTTLPFFSFRFSLPASRFPCSRLSSPHITLILSTFAYLSSPKGRLFFVFFLEFTTYSLSIARLCCLILPVPVPHRVIAHKRDKATVGQNQPRLKNNKRPSDLTTESNAERNKQEEGHEYTNTHRQTDTEDKRPERPKQKALAYKKSRHTKETSADLHRH